MFFSVQELELRKVHFNEQFAPGEIDLAEGSLKQSGDLHAEGRAELLSNSLGEIRIQGELSVKLEVSCDRCLEPVDYPVNGPFELYYRPLPKGPLPPEAAINDGESQIGFYEGAGIELSEILREHILLALPMHQLCREDCAGICAQCGQNKNAGTCDCNMQPEDDRWAALKDLRASLRTGS